MEVAMAWRICFLGLGFLAGYVACSWTAHRHASRPRLRGVLGVGVLGLILVWTLWQAVAWRFFLPRDLLTYLPLDALVVGVAAGWIVADHKPEVVASGRADASRPSRGLGPRSSDGAGHAQPSGAQPRDAEAPPDGRAPSRGADWLTRVSDSLQGAVTTLGLLLLFLLGTAPPQFWAQLFERLEGIEAGGVEVRLGTAAGQGVAQSIIASTTAPEVLGRTRREEHHGFIPHRLERMQSLTHPPAVTQVRDATLGQNATGLLFAKPVTLSTRSAAAGAGMSPAVRDLQRDRAMLLHLHRGARATDTRAQAAVSAAGDDPVGFFKVLGKAQEGVLARLAPHVACVHEVISETSDRRLLEYQTARVVEELYRLARMWSSLEAAHLHRHLQTFDQAPRSAGQGAAERNALRAAREELNRQAHRFSIALYDFTYWADTVIYIWRSARPALPEGARSTSTAPSLTARAGAADASAGAPTTAPSAQGGGEGAVATWWHRPAWLAPDVVRTRPVSRHCSFERRDIMEIENYVKSLGDDDFKNHAFTPYLAVFVAQALSAMGDTTAALRLILNWQSDLENLLKLIRGRSLSHLHAASWMQDTHQMHEQNEYERLFLFTAQWFELTTFADMIILQQLSEQSNFPLPPTENGLHHLTARLYPQIFALLQQDTTLREWRRDTSRGCKSPSHSWRQPLVLSYATWVKSYLDVRNKNLIRPDDLTAGDVELADMLAALDLECFPDEMDVPSRNRQRAEFDITVAAIQLNLLVTHKLDADQKQERRLRLQASMQRTIHLLERETPLDRASPSAESLIFAREDSMLSSAKSINTRLDQLSRRFP
jgi:hypothetical protein